MNTGPEFVLQTERLALRPLRYSDIDAMNAVFGDPEVTLYDDGAKAPGWVRQWLHDRIADYGVRPGIGVWAVESGESTIGYCGLFYLDDLNGEPAIAIGYRLARAYWGNGLATEAAMAVRDYVFEKLGVHTLVATIDPGNANSIRVAKKLGMRHTGEIMYAGYTHPDNVYAVSQAGFPEQRS